MKFRLTLLGFALTSYVLASAACGSDGAPSTEASAGSQGGAEAGTSQAAAGTGAGGDDPAAVDYAVEACKGAPAPPPGDATCIVTKGDARLFVVGDILTPGHVAENGGVLIDEAGVVTCSGCDCAAKASGATTVACSDAVISPGLINAHDHVGWMNGRPWVAADAGVDPALRWEQRHDWRKGKRGNPTIKVSGGNASTTDKLWGELRFALGGATATFGSGDLGGLLRDLDATGSGSTGLGKAGASYETFPLGDSSGTQQSEGCVGYSIGGAAPASVAADVPHVAEGIDDVARNEFHCLTGKGQGAADVLDHRTAIVHGVGLGPDEVATMAERGMRLVWSPRSNVSLYGDTAWVTLFRASGVAIGLGSDWLPSGSMNMLRELACAAQLNDSFFGRAFTDQELWQMATVGSARALGMDDAIGVLVPGRRGDVAVFRKNGRTAFSAVVGANVEDVALVLRNGKVLVGDTATVDALESGCDALEVCGVAKSVCVSRDSGKTLAQLKASAPAYPLFFCGTPEDEPTCLPSRTLSVDRIDGSTSYEGISSPNDKDGDGIANDDDDCPTLFNPVRPVDGGKQADLDQDGLGDACDPCPRSNGDGCTPPKPFDADGDGKDSWLDNCPSDTNVDQADGDGDGHGDACDSCPKDANPGTAKCPGAPTTIFAIQNPSAPNHPAQKARVRVECVVTAVGTTFTWCQDPLGGAYSGIASYLGTFATYPNGDPVLVGDRVTIDGDYEEYQGATQLSATEFAFIGKSTLPPAMLVSAADIATGGISADTLQGVLVVVKGVSVTNVNPDAPNDYDEFVVTGNLRIDDQALDNTKGGALDNANFMLGQTLSSITGIVHYTYKNSKLLPRALADIVN